MVSRSSDSGPSSSTHGRPGLDRGGAVPGEAVRPERRIDERRRADQERVRAAAVPVGHDGDDARSASPRQGRRLDEPVDAERRDRRAGPRAGRRSPSRRARPPRIVPPRSPRSGRAPAPPARWRGGPGRARRRPDPSSRRPCPRSVARRASRRASASGSSVTSSSRSSASRPSPSRVFADSRPRIGTSAHVRERSARAAGSTAVIVPMRPPAPRPRAGHGPRRRP